MKTFETSNQAGKTTVFKGILRGLLVGQLKGGDRLTEVAAAEWFAVSRTPVREALLELSSLGIVQLRRNCGAVLQPFGEEQLRELYALRALLEGEAARLAASRIPLPEVQVLRERVEGLRSVQEGDVDWVTDRELHRVISQYAGNQRLADEISRHGGLIQTIREMPEEFPLQYMASTIEEHLGILACLERRDGRGASEAMQWHIHRAEGVALQALEGLRKEANVRGA